MTDAMTELRERGLATVTPNYAPGLVLERGEGMYVWDVAGEKYLDFLAGIAVNVLGHCHPTYVERVTAQVKTLLQVSNIFFSEPQIRLQETLVARSFADRVFFCNSGAEANEAALKMARRYQRVAKGTDRFEIITMTRSFHGRTFGAITATGQPKYHEGFEPMVPGFRYAEFNDLDSVAALVTDKTAAILVEPIQGEGGVRPATPEFLTGLRHLCDSEGVLLLFDEVQTGMGRTGTLFAYQQYGVEPDIMSLAKGLGGGLPIGAMLCREEVACGFQPGSHATTFGGNPVVTAAGLAVFEVMDAEGLLANTRRQGARFMEGLTRLSEKDARLGPPRGRGLMIGLPFAGDLNEMVGASRGEGLLHNAAGGEVLRFLPPLTLSESHVDEALTRLQSALARTR